MKVVKMNKHAKFQGTVSTSYQKKMLRNTHIDILQSKLGTSTDREQNLITFQGGQDTST